MNRYQRISLWVRRAWRYVSALLEWVFLSILIGSICGTVGSVFHIGVELATHARGTYPWLLWCLPLAGLAIVGLYRLMGTQGLGTNDIIDAVHQDEQLPILLLPSIFLGTILTHLCGGSAGREGAALQMGGAIGQSLGRLLRLKRLGLRIATLSGMAAFFSALFGTPLTAAVFAIMVISVGQLYDAAFVPCLTSSLTAYGISLLLGVSPTRFTVTVPPLGSRTLLQTAALAILCALVSILFCEFLHLTEHWMARRLKNAWIRVFVGGAVVIALTYLSGVSDYNGAGMDVIAAAVESGQVRPGAFLWKLLFTAVTLAAGFKGGEVVPSFFVGATFGAMAAPILHLPAGYGAAVGLVSVFCGATNCPIPSILLSVELFGAEGILYFSLSCAISYMLSGYSGLYSSQTIAWSKLDGTPLKDVHTNGYDAGLEEAAEDSPEGTNAPDSKGKKG